MRRKHLERLPGVGGGKIAFVRRGNVYVINAEGSRQRRLTRNAASDGGPVWSLGRKR
jgi:hypothetical protein